MSARNYWPNDELVRDAVYNRRREAELREQLVHAGPNSYYLDNVAALVNKHDMRALASENVLASRIERVLRRQTSPYAPSL